MPSLFAVYLGGRADRCNTELHDVVFAVGSSLKDCKNQLVEKWFGNSDRLHVDSWIEMANVDGHRLELRKEVTAESAPKLYFVNLGAYKDGDFTEIHGNAFLVCQDATEAKNRAKEKLCVGLFQVHTDDLFEVDDLIEITSIDGYHVHLSPAPGIENSQPHGAYLPMAKL